MIDIELSELMFRTLVAGKKVRILVPDKKEEWEIRLEPMDYHTMAEAIINAMPPVLPEVPRKITKPPVQGFEVQNLLNDLTVLKCKLVEVLDRCIGELVIAEFTCPKCQHRNVYPEMAKRRYCVVCSWFHVDGMKNEDSA